MQKAFEEVANNIHLDNGEPFSLDHPMITSS